MAPKPFSLLPAYKQAIEPELEAFRANPLRKTNKTIIPKAVEKVAALANITDTEGKQAVAKVR